MRGAGISDSGRQAGVDSWRARAHGGAFGGEDPSRAPAPVVELLQAAQQPLEARGVRGHRPLGVT
eukprot:5154607-Prymnesium_polylepis.1